MRPSPIRKTARSTTRRTTRPASRMLSGARRPRHPNYFTLAARAFAELVRIDTRMKPYIHELAQRQKHREWMETVVEPALEKVYGPSDEPLSPPMVEVLTDKQIAQLRRDELALIKSQLVLASITSKLAKAPRLPRRASLVVSR